MITIGLTITNENVEDSEKEKEQALSLMLRFVTTDSSKKMKTNA